MILRSSSQSGHLLKVLLQIPQVRSFRIAAAVNKQRRVTPLVYTVKKKKPSVDVFHEMSISDLASKLGFSVDHIHECLEYLNVKPASTDPNQVIKDTAVIGSVAALCGFRFQFVKRARDGTKSDKLESKDVYKRRQLDRDAVRLLPRPPIVTIMGHVDHGKTTLLDRLRQSRIVDQEFGGITQHIGAFSVSVSPTNKIVFIDTPGHAAFCSMRERGVKLTDLVVLVVAADDGVMPQTAECLQHIRDANVPFIVAINKIDKSNADIKATTDSLLRFGIQIEECGGDVIAVRISALKGHNVDELLKSILALTELMDIRGDSTGLAEATVIESRMDDTHGPICTAIVNRGTLRPGAFLVSGTTCARVRRLLDEGKKSLTKSELSQPIQITGWSEAPGSGEEVIEVESKQRMDEVMRYRKQKVVQEKEQIDGIAADEARVRHLEKYKDELRRKRETGRVFRKVVGPTYIAEERTKPMLPILVKADVQGSLEAINDSLLTYVPSLVDLEVVQNGIGDVTVGNVELAAAVNGVVYAFNVHLRSDAHRLAEKLGVLVKEHRVIYHLFDDIRDQLGSRVVPVEQEEVLGEAVVQQVFSVATDRSVHGNNVWVAGCRCTSGQLGRHSIYKVIRNKETVHRGQLGSMKHFKEDVSIVEKGRECGLVL